MFVSGNPGSPLEDSYQPVRNSLSSGQKSFISTAAVTTAALVALNILSAGGAGALPLAVMVGGVSGLGVYLLASALLGNQGRTRIRQMPPQPSFFYRFWPFNAPSSHRSRRVGGVGGRQVPGTDGVLLDHSNRMPAVRGRSAQPRADNGHQVPGTNVVLGSSSNTRPARNELSRAGDGGRQVAGSDEVVGYSITRPAAGDFARAGAGGRQVAGSNVVGHSNTRLAAGDFSRAGAGGRPVAGSNTVFAGHPTRSDDVPSVGGRSAINSRAESSAGQFAARSASRNDSLRQPPGSRR